MVEFAVAAGAFVDDGSLVIRTPPPPAERFLPLPQLKQPTSPMEPRPRSFQVPPCACDTSSITASPCRWAMARMGLHVAAHPAEVDGHDRAGARGDGGLDGRRRDVVGLGIDVGKDRDEARVQDGRDAGEEGDGGDDDLGAAVQAEGLEGDLKGAGAAVEADAVAGAVGRGEGLLELDDGVVVGAVAGAETVGEGGDVLLGENGPGGEGLGADGGAAGEREGWHVRTDFRG